MKNNQRFKPLYQPPFTSQQSKKTLSFKDLIANLDSQNMSNHDLIKQFKEKSKNSKTSQVILKGTDTITKNQSITLSCEKKEIIITEIVVSEKTTKIVINNEGHFDRRGEVFGEEEDEDIEYIVAKKLSDLVDTLEKYCEEKGVVVPKEITIEQFGEECKIYVCMYNVTSAQFRTLPIYTCPVSKLDELCTQDAPKSALKQIILKQYKKLLKEIIPQNSILKSLFDLLLNPAFTFPKLQNKRQLIFLQLLAEGIFCKKKRGNKKRNKRKNEGERGNEDSEEQEQVSDKQFDDLSSKIFNLCATGHRVRVKVSPGFVEGMGGTGRKSNDS